MANSDATGLQEFDGFTTLTTLVDNTAHFEWLEDHSASFPSPVLVPPLCRPATVPATSSELRCHRRRQEALLAPRRSVWVSTPVAVAQDFLPPRPAPLPRNPFVEEPASS
jgi:hypothetical protein